MTTQDPMPEPLTIPAIEAIDAYSRASLYLCTRMLYLGDNPVLKETLRIEHIKKRLLGHWGSDPGQTPIWIHLSRRRGIQDRPVSHCLARGQVPQSDT